LVNGWAGRAEKGTQAADYIWKPADDLDRLEGVQAARPEAFLDLAKWWTGHEARVKDEGLRKLFVSSAKGERSGP
jgi:hypothetical protein